MPDGSTDPHAHAGRPAQAADGRSGWAPEYTPPGWYGRAPTPPAPSLPWALPGTSPGTAGASYPAAVPAAAHPYGSSPYGSAPVGGFPPGQAPATVPDERGDRGAEPHAVGAARPGRGAQSRIPALPRGLAACGRPLLRLCGREPARERQRRLEVIRAPLHRCHRVAVVSLKGGVGKTTIALALGATLARERADRVLAVDANPDSGTLGRRVQRETGATVRDLLHALPQVHNYMDLRQFTSLTSGGLEVLANDPDPALSRAFGEESYRSVLRTVGCQYPIVVTDSGTGFTHSATRGVLDLADQLIVIAAPSVDSADSAAIALDHLAADGHHELVQGSIALLSGVRSAQRPVRLCEIVEYFERRCQAVLTVPFDEHLATGGEFGLHRLRPRTRAAFLTLAAHVAERFPPRPRQPAGAGDHSHGQPGFGPSPATHSQEHARDGSQACSWGAPAAPSPLPAPAAPPEPPGPPPAGPDMAHNPYARARHRRPS